MHSWMKALIQVFARLRICAQNTSNLFLPTCHLHDGNLYIGQAPTQKPPCCLLHMHVCMTICPANIFVAWLFSPKENGWARQSGSLFSLRSMKCLTGKDVADSVLHMLAAPPHCGIHDILMLPVEQPYVAGLWTTKCINACMFSTFRPKHDSTSLWLFKSFLSLPLWFCEHSKVKCLTGKDVADSVLHMLAFEFLHFLDRLDKVGHA